MVLFPLSAKIEASLTDLLKHYKIRQLVDPFIVKPDEPDRVKPPPKLEEIYARVEQITSFDVAPEGEDWENAGQTFPFLPAFPLVLYGDVGAYCPVSLRDERWLLPGKPRFNLQVRQRNYFLFDKEKMYKFKANTRRYLPSLNKCNDENETSILKVPPPRIAFLGSPGSQVDERVVQLSNLYAVPVVELPAAFPTALLKQVRLHLRQTRRRALEEAIADLNEKVISPLDAEEENLIDQLLSLSSGEFVNAPVDSLKQSWASLQEATQQALCQEALRTLLHPMMGPAFIQAGPITNPLLKVGETRKNDGDLPGDSVDIGRLMDSSARLPDCVVIFLCSNDVAVRRCLDLQQIDRDADEAKRQKESQRRHSRKGRAHGDEDEGEEAVDGSDEESDDPRTASEKARDEFIKRKSEQDAVLLRSAKSFAAAGVPVLTVRSELCEGTFMAAIKHFLDRFMNYRRSLLLSPQCIPLPKVRIRGMHLSNYTKCSSVDFGFKSADDSPLNRRIGSMRTQPDFPSSPTSNCPPSRSTHEERCLETDQLVAFAAILSATPPDARCKAFEVRVVLSPGRGLSCKLSRSLHLSRPHGWKMGKQIAACCLSRLIAARLQSSEAKQRGFILDGCGMEGVDAQRLLELLQAGPKEAVSLAAKHATEHDSGSYSSLLAEESIAAESPADPSTPPSPQSSKPRSSLNGELSSLEHAPAASNLESMLTSPKRSADLKAVVPPLQLTGLRRSSSAGAPEDYSMPTASSKDAVSAASGNARTNSSAGPETTEQQVVEEPSQPSEASEVDPPAFFERRPALIDAVFVFQPEKEDLYSVEQRVLLEKQGQDAARSPTRTRLRYPYGDDRDILIHSDLAEFRRMRQEAARRQHAEVLSTAGALIVGVPAGASEWLQFDVAHKIVENVLRRRHSYERLKSLGRAAQCPLKGEDPATSEGPLAAYCPVCLTADLFLKMPEAYIHRRLPAVLPTRCPPSGDNEQPACSEEAVALKGYCPVTLVSTGELTKGCLELLVMYGGQMYAFASEEALQRFMLHPAGYASHAQLPERLSGTERFSQPQRTLANIAKDAHARYMQAAEDIGSPTDPLMAEEGLAALREQVKDALTYIEISSVDLLIEGLLFVGKNRVLHPHFSPIASTVQLVAHYLHANNPLLSGHAKADAEEALRNFVEDCETPFEARKAIVQRHYHLNKRYITELSEEQQEAFKMADCGQVQEQEWTYFSELQYERVTKRFDKLFHVK
ncbi:hypothetical protein ACSSS7_000073 [Eimeria intestinalis]